MVISQDVIQEKIIPQDMSLSNTVEMIIRDVFKDRYLKLQEV